MKQGLESVGEHSAVLEGLFAPGWDHGNDVLVVVGPSEQTFFDALQQLGQLRVIEVAARDSLDPLPPEPYVRVTNPLEVFHAVLKYQGDTAKQAAVRRQPAATISEAELGEFVDALRGAISTADVFRRSTFVLAPQWAEHGVRNLPDIAKRPSIGSLKEAFKGVPCVIVSPGPSLDRNAHLLRELSGSALIMTCSHALRAIEDAGVHPDVITVSDPKFTGRHFDKCDAAKAGTLFLDSVVDPRNFEIESQRVFSFVSHLSVASWTLDVFGDSALIETGGSVACAEFSIAIHLGCDPIVLVGQDLALTDGRYYAKASIDGMAFIEPSEDASTFELVRPHLLGEEEKLMVTRHPEEGMVEIPAWGGGNVHTSESLFTFLQWFKAAAHSTDRRLFNCTEGGAYIDGMQHISLREFIDSHDLPSVNIGETLDRGTASLDFVARCAAMKLAVEEMLVGLGNCRDKATHCKNLASRAHRDPSALEELGVAEGLLSEALGPIPVLSMFAQARIRDAQAEAEQAKTLKGNLAAAKKLFQVVIEAAGLLEQPLEQSLCELSD